MDNIRTSTLVLHNQSKHSMRGAQKSISKIVDQVTSGVESRDFHGISHKTNLESHLSNKNVLETLEKRMVNNRLLEKKLTAIENNVLGLQGVVTDGLVLSLRSRTTTSANALNTEDLAKQQLAKIHSLLQGEFNGQYLFAGSDVRNMPVEDFVNNTNLIAGNVTANYYNGNNDAMKSKISETNDIEYGFKANDSSVQKLIGAFHKMIEGKNLNDPTKYQEATDLLQEAKTEIGDYIAKLGNNYSIVENQVDFDERLSLRLKETVSDVESTDIPKAMGDMVNTQTQLQASYMLLVRANAITLADYLH